MKSALKILLVEDELLIAHTMKEMLHELGYKNVKIANTQTLAESVISEKNCELAILDINLGKGEEGIELAKKCHILNIPFFYTTSYTDKHTLDRALETAPGAYLIKPYLQSSLYTALQITINKHSGKEETYSFKDGSEIIKLKLSQLIYLQADNVYTKIFTSQKVYLERNSLHNVLNSLPKSKFVQTHRSFIINLDYVTKISGNLVHLGEISVPISRSNKQILKEKLMVS